MVMVTSVLRDIIARAEKVAICNERKKWVCDAYGGNNQHLK